MQHTTRIPCHWLNAHRTFTYEGRVFCVYNPLGKTVCITHTMHHAVANPDLTLSVVAGTIVPQHNTQAMFDVGYCEGGDVILTSPSSLIWTITDKRPVVANGLLGANAVSTDASDDLPTGRIYAVHRREGNRWYTTYGRRNVMNGEIDDFFAIINSDGTRMYICDTDMAYIDTITQQRVSSLLHRESPTHCPQIHPWVMHTPSSLVYYITGDKYVQQCDVRCPKLIPLDGFISGELSCGRSVGDCILAHRRIVVTNQLGHVQVMGERIMVYDARNCAEYHVGEYTPYHHTHFYI